MDQITAEISKICSNYLAKSLRLPKKKVFCYVTFQYLYSVIPKKNLSKRHSH